MSASKPATPAVNSSGEVVARLFHRALAAVFLIAWLSLGRQVLLLVGRRGLLPLADFVAAAGAEHALSFGRFPSVLVWAPTDGMLLGGCVAGVVLSLLALFGVRPRLCAAAQTLWYLGYVTACRGFLGFQWDNLLLECGFLAAFLSVERPAPLARLLMRAVLFKLYFESGLAKWQSPLHDWQDGSAMTFYYETAPLPTALAWYAHHLPRWWHLFESRATLAIELVLPFAIFGPRRARLLSAALFTLFQIINAATANYGFFCYLATALHLFLLEDSDVRALGGLFRRFRLFTPRPPAGEASSASRSAARMHCVAARTGAAAWILLSLSEAWFTFGEPGPAGQPLLPLLQLSQTFRVVNTYHLFAAVTRERVEPEFQVQAHADGPWIPYHLHYKPGPTTRSPPFVAPHQPRADFLLWFYGLGWNRRPPSYVSELLARLCDEPRAMAALFDAPPPDAPVAVRVVFWDYHFSSPADKRSTGAWWTRRQIAEGPSLTCSAP